MRNRVARVGNAGVLLPVNEATPLFSSTQQAARNIGAHDLVNSPVPERAATVPGVVGIRNLVGIRGQLSLPLTRRADTNNQSQAVPREIDTGGQPQEERGQPRNDVERRDRNREKERADIDARRQRQGEYMEGVNQESRTPVHRGDIVIIYPDARDQAAGALRGGFPAVVINDPMEPAYSVRVQTEHGILVVGTNRRTLLINRRMYRIPSGSMRISDTLRSLQTQVRLGNFGDNAARISMREAHRLYHQVPRQVMCNCRAKKNRCGSMSRCPCVKDGRMCSSDCGCGPECQNKMM